MKLWVLPKYIRTVAFVPACNLNCLWSSKSCQCMYRNSGRIRYYLWIHTFFRWWFIAFWLIHWFFLNSFICIVTNYMFNSGIGANVSWVPFAITPITNAIKSSFILFPIFKLYRLLTFFPGCHLCIFPAVCKNLDPKNYALQCHVPNS